MARIEGQNGKHYLGHAILDQNSNIILLYFLGELQEWEEKARKDKERYAEEMKSYKPSGSDTAPTKDKKKNESPTKKTAASMTGSGFKSKEYISDESSSAGSDDEKSKKKVCFIQDLFLSGFVFDFIILITHYFFVSIF